MTMLSLAASTTAFVAYRNVCLSACSRTFDKRSSSIGIVCADRGCYAFTAVDLLSYCTRTLTVPVAVVVPAAPVIVTV